jgi:hypothetical protein
MTEAPHKPEKPDDPPYPGGEDESPREEENTSHRSRTAPSYSAPEAVPRHRAPGVSFFD